MTIRSCISRHFIFSESPSDPLLNRAFGVQFEKPATDKKKPTWRDPDFYKPYITSSQMTQFCIMMFQASWDMYAQPFLFSGFCVVFCFSF